MAYSTSTSILSQLPGLPQTSGASGYTSTLSLIASHITRADNLINGKIASRYDVSSFNDTTTSIPPLLTSISEDIAAYYTFRSQFSGDNYNINEWVEKYQECIQKLDEIRNGDMDLVDTDHNLIGGSSTTLTIQSNTDTFTPTFDEGPVLDWSVDGDKYA